MYLNKGKYGHIGGWFHAYLHGLGSFFIIFIFYLYKSPVVYNWWFALALFDMMLHYHIDWTKVNITKKYGWSKYITIGGPCSPHDSGITSGLLITSNQFFIALGLDQLAHYLTYALMIYFLTL
jgi:hypothetical protein